MHIPPAGVHTIALALARALNKRTIAKMRNSIYANISLKQTQKMHEIEIEWFNRIVEDTPQWRGGAYHIGRGGGPTGVWGGVEKW